ncbi:MAG: hypothetical protein BZY88_09420 [SAR202 cluster bacterium Io17-Chloro-G9]|nr:MAG: hypothetical protein BZY88_09420 [SAR202 cluster bacterium Io17-Chloro-G9]
MRQTKANLLLLNVRVLDLETKLEPAPVNPLAVAIKDGTIAGVASKDEVSGLAGPGASVVDCGGKALMPGLVDAHCHLLALAASLLGIDCGPRNVSSIQQLQQMVHRQVRETPPGRWVRGFGYDDTALVEGRHPNRWDLDPVSPDHPVRLDHRSGHASVLNSRALELAGINDETPDPVEGIIDRDPASGKPTGLLLEMADYLRLRVGPSRDKTEFQIGVKSLNRKLLEYGITSAHDAGPSNGLDRWQTFQELKSSGLLSSRIVMMAGASNLQEFQQSNLGFGYEDDGLRIGQAKIMLTSTTGSLHPGTAELEEMVREAHAAGFPVAIHAVEQEAVAAASSVLTNQGMPRGIGAGRDRIEHCSECPAELIDQVARSGAAVVTQPGLIYWNGDSYLANVEPGLLPHLYPAGALHRSGVPLAFGSDAPVTDPNPWPAIYSAVTRRTSSGTALPRKDNQASLDQRVPVRDALRMYTSAGGSAAKFGGIHSGIKAGYPADLVLLEADPTRVDEDSLKNIRAVMTIIGGKVAWEG